ncbi:MAG: hypothetical protein K2N01_07635, partial [Lachnospiraceae bacterium]|nr:hypothetical protein [Lachnospiraceae bacterium]
MGEIVSQDNIDSYIPELSSDAAQNKFKEILGWNKKIKKGSKTWSDYYQTLDDNEDYIIDLIKGTDDLSKLTSEDLVEANQAARASAISHNEAIKAQSLSARAGQVALKGLAAAGNMFLMLAIVKVIQGIITGVDNMIHSAEHCKERVDELMSAYHSSLDTANSKADRAEELAGKYETLSKGVNNLGQNISLTNEEYAEYHSLTNEIAEMFPNLIKGWTAEGDAILSLKGNVDELRDSYKQAQQEAYNTLITSGEDADGNDILENWNNLHETGFWASTFDFGYDDVGGAISMADALRQLEAIQNMTAEEYREIERIAFAGTTSELDSLSELEREIGNSGYLYGALDIDYAVSDEDFAIAQKKAKVLAQTYRAEIEAALSDVETLANAYLMTNADYAKLDEQSQNAASIIVNNLNAYIASDFNSKEEVGEYVDKIVQMISSNPAARNALIGLLSMDTSDMPISDIKYWVNEYINTIAGFLNEDPLELKIRLGFENVDSLAENYEKIVDNAIIKFTNGIIINKPTLLGNGEKQYTSESLAEKEILDEFAQKNSINTQDEIAFWNQCIEESDTREEAMEKYLNSSFSSDESDSTTQTISSSIQQIDAQLEPQFAKLGDAYRSIFTDEGFTLDAVDNSMLENLRQSFTEIEEQTGIAFDASVLDPFFDTLTDESSTAEQVQQAFNDLATSYLYSTDVLEQLNDETAESVKKQLEQMGITNADELVTYALTEAKMKAALASFDFANASGSLKDTMLQEAGALGLTEAQTTSLANAYSNAQAYMTSALNSGANERLKKLGSELSAIKSYSDALNVLSGKYGYTDSWRYYADGYFESDQQWMRDILDYGKSLDNAQAIIDAAINTQAQYKGLHTSSRNSKDAAQETTETFNWLETLLSRIQRKITNFGKTVSAVWQNWSKRNNAAIQQLAAIREELTTQQQAYDTYLAKADSVGLSGYYQDLVKNGSIRIEDITDDGLKEQIKAFQDWYEKALAASDAIADLKDNLADLAKTRFDNVSKQFEQKLGLIEHEADLTNNRLEQAEAKGYLVSSSYYEFLIALEEDTLAQLKQQHAALESTLQTSVADGTVELYSEQWYDMVSGIQKAEKDIGDAELSIINHNNKLRELDWNLFDRSQEQMAQIPKEADFLLSLMENSDLYDESGSLNRLGNAAAGLHAVSLNTYMAQADDYAKEIARIDRELAEDPYNTILLDRRKELLDSQQDMISSAEDERQAIKDLV